MSDGELGGEGTGQTPNTTNTSLRLDPFERTPGPKKIFSDVQRKRGTFMLFVSIHKLKILKKPLEQNRFEREPGRKNRKYGGVSGEENGHIKHLGKKAQGDRSVMAQSFI